MENSVILEVPRGRLPHPVVLFYLQLDYTVFRVLLDNAAGTP